MSVIQRLQAPTPKFFKVLQLIGLSLAAAGGTLLATPAELPASVTDVAGYLAVAGGVMTAVSQVTVPVEPDDTDGPGAVLAVR